MLLSRSRRGVRRLVRTLETRCPVAMARARSPRCSAPSSSPPIGPTKISSRASDDRLRRRASQRGSNYCPDRSILIIGSASHVRGLRDRAVAAWRWPWSESRHNRRAVRTRSGSGTGTACRGWVLRSPDPVIDRTRLGIPGPLHRRCRIEVAALHGPRVAGAGEVKKRLPASGGKSFRSREP